MIYKSFLFVYSFTFEPEPDKKIKTLAAWSFSELEPLVDHRFIINKK